MSICGVSLMYIHTREVAHCVVSELLLFTFLGVKNLAHEDLH